MLYSVFKNKCCDTCQVLKNRIHIPRAVLDNKDHNEPKVKVCIVWLSLSFAEIVIHKIQPVFR